MKIDGTNFLKRLKLMRSEVKVEELAFVFVGRIHISVVKK